jgi:Ca2+-binding RTX toxin-like protein
MANITGTENDDILNGTPNDDIIAGLGGNDTINGGEGIDQLYGYDGGDTINGDGGNDFLSGNAGNDTLSGGAGADNLNGGDGVDQQFGGDGDDTFYVQLLADIVAGEVYDGGSGSDTLQIVQSTYQPTPLDLTGVTLTGIEVLDASSYPSLISVKLTMAQVQGFSSITGTIYFSTGGSLNLSGITLNGTLILSDSATTINAAGVSTPHGGGVTVIGGAGIDQLTGSALADYLSGKAGNDTLAGGDGDDTIIGGLGIDSISGGAGNDLLQFGSPDDIGTGETIDGGSGCLCRGSPYRRAA